jgi:alpha-L-fucosidase
MTARLLVPLLLCCTPRASAVTVPKPSPSQLKWQQQELGVIIHYNMITGKGQGCPGMGPRGLVSPPNASLFQPAPGFDATEWMETINAMGAKYAVYVAKHGCGFCTWRTNATFMNGTRYPYATGGPHGATSVDVVQAFLKAARAANVLPGFYYSLTSNNFLDHEKVNATEFEYIVMQQIRELWDRESSGELFEIWMDGGYQPNLKANLSALLLAQQPSSVVFNGCDPVNGCLADAGNARWIGTEAGSAPPNTWSTGTHYGAGDPNSTIWNPAESDTTLQLGDNWFYNGPAIRSLDQLVQVYHATVGRNTNLLLDIAPMPNGSIPVYAKARYAEFGAWIKGCYGKAPAATGTLATSSSRSIVVQISAAVDRCRLSEDMSNGQVSTQTIHHCLWFLDLF